MKNRYFIAACALSLAAGIVSAQPKPVPVVVPDDDEVQSAIERVREKMEAVRADMEFRHSDMELRHGEMAELKAKIAGEMDAHMSAKLAGDAALKLSHGAFALAQKRMPGRQDSQDRLYDRGQHALEGRRWDEALDAFSQAATQTGSRTDGALYWKAYALHKLGRRDEAQAALAELRKAHPSSRWLNDAGALELEVKQAAGQKVSPESESDEELKLMALNGLVQSDPERALPLLEKLLKSSQSPRLKDRTLFVLAQSDAPRAAQLLEQVARGGAGNPDLQLRAISYLGVRSRKADNSPLLREIYTSTEDPHVKRALLSAFLSRRDKDSLLQAVRSEKSEPVRLEAISMLGACGAQAELVQLYQAETSTDAKIRIVQSIGSRGGAQLIDLARAEKDPKLRRAAIQAVGWDKAGTAGDALVAMYASETDPQVKRTILDSLSRPSNAKLLVELARKETDAGLKREIVARLSSMKSKEAADYLLELLK